MRRQYYIPCLGTPVQTDGRRADCSKWTGHKLLFADALGKWAINAAIRRAALRQGFERRRICRLSFRTRAIDGQDED